MTTTYWIGGLLAVFVLGYLVYALFNAEDI